VATSGGHRNLTVYLLTSQDESKYRPIDPVRPGQVWKGQVGSDGVIQRWTAAMGSGSATVRRAYSLFVNPYNPNELYVSDIEAKAIKSSHDGGQSWQPDPALTGFATNSGEFRFEWGASRNLAVEAGTACSKPRVR
jgi:hypothetical protein